MRVFVSVDSVQSGGVRLPGIAVLGAGQARGRRQARLGFPSPLAPARGQHVRGTVFLDGPSSWRTPGRLPAPLGRSLVWILLAPVLPLHSSPSVTFLHDRHCGEGCVGISWVWYPAETAGHAALPLGPRCSLRKGCVPGGLELLRPRPPAHCSLLCI